MDNSPKEKQLKHRNISEAGLKRYVPLQVLAETCTKGRREPGDRRPKIVVNQVSWWLHRAMDFMREFWARIIYPDAEVKKIRKFQNQEKDKWPQMTQIRFFEQY